MLTRKNPAVVPPCKAPYLIFVCLARSSALSMGESIRSTVKNAAKLAVYDDIIMSVKNHHIPTHIRANENYIFIVIIMRNEYIIEMMLETCLQPFSLTMLYISHG
jgi:hypothetical protein